MGNLISWYTRKAPAHSFWPYPRPFPQRKGEMSLACAKARLNARAGLRFPERGIIILLLLTAAFYYVWGCGMYRWLNTA